MGIKITTWGSKAWRFIDSAGEPGFINMAIDEAILKGMEQEQKTPVLRFYTWSSPTLSLGYKQKLSFEQWQALNPANNIDLVRRPTGGGAVLHHKELTYAVILPKKTISSNTAPHEDYKQINNALIAGLAVLGIKVAIPQNKNHHDNSIVCKQSCEDNFLCFSETTFSDIAINNYKLIGSAQLRKRNSFLQHGSILINKETIIKGHPLWNNRSSITITEILGHTPCLDEVKQAILKGFSDIFNCRFIPSSLTSLEETIFNSLIKQKYNNHTWLF